MNHAKRLLDLFYRLHWALRAGVAPEYGWGDRSIRIAQGQMPEADIYEGEHRRIYGDATNLRIAHKVEHLSHRGLVEVYVERSLRGEWRVEVSCYALGQKEPAVAALVAQELAHAAKIGGLCEEILAQPMDFDVHAGRDALSDAIEGAWTEVGRDGDPDEALACAWKRLSE